MTEKLFSAIEFACFHHRGQSRKGSSIPYIVHPIGVMQLVARFGGSETMQIAALFHDLLEDTGTNEKEIEEKFGSEVLDLVKGLTEPEYSLSKIDSWKIRKAHTLGDLEKQSLNVICVSLCDKYDNLYSVEQDIIVLKEKIWDRFRAPYQDQKWYYSSLAKTFIQRLENSGTDFYLLAERFESLVKKLFF